MTDYELMKRYMAIKGCILDMYESLANARTKKERSDIAELAHELGDACAYYSGNVMKNFTRDARHEMVRQMAREFLAEYVLDIAKPDGKSDAKEANNNDGEKPW